MPEAVLGDLRIRYREAGQGFPVLLLHGGFCLYNGGFTCGIVAFVLVPVLECFLGTKEERTSR